MQQCPECWSGIDSDLVTCPQCGHVLAQAKRRIPTWIWPLGAILCAAGGWLLLSQSKRPDTNRATDPAEVTDPLALEARPESGPEARPDPDPTPLVHWQLSDGKHQVPVLLLTSQAGPTGIIPLATLPLDGPLLEDGVAIDVDIVHHDTTHGYALLRFLTVPQGSTSLLCTTSTNANPDLIAWTPQRTEVRDIRIARRNVEGLIILDHAIEAASAILTAEDRVIAYALGGNLALPLDAALPWLNHAQSRPLSVVQQELRAEDPSIIVRDAAERLTQPLEVAKVREAISLLQKGLHLARDRQLINRYDELQRIAWQNLVRLLSPDNSASAISEGRRGLAFFPDHKGLLADVIRLMARHGNPLEAADLYIQLNSLSPDHAQQTADSLARGLAARGRQQIKENRISEGLAQYARAVALFPLRADLQMAYATALRRSGDKNLALYHARQAASLDPSFTKQLARFAQTESSGGRTEIPFDPRTNVINAEVTVGGIPLSLVVDTGATMTTIPTALADQLNLRSPANRRVTVTTASGKVQGEVVLLPLMKIGNLRLRNVEAVIMDLPNQLQNKGLLGMNALKRTQIQIDTERGRLILQRKRRSR